MYSIGCHVGYRQLRYNKDIAQAYHLPYWSETGSACSLTGRPVSQEACSYGSWHIKPTSNNYRWRWPTDQKLCATSHLSRVALECTANILADGWHAHMFGACVKEKGLSVFVIWRTLWRARKKSSSKFVFLAYKKTIILHKWSFYKIGIQMW